MRPEKKKGFGVEAWDFPRVPAEESMRFTSIENNVEKLDVLLR